MAAMARRSSRHAGHRRVLVQPFLHRGMHVLDERRIRLEVREALAKVDAAVLSRERGHDREDGGPHAGQPRLEPGRLRRAAAHRRSFMSLGAQPRSPQERERPSRLGVGAREQGHDDLVAAGVREASQPVADTCTGCASGACSCGDECPCSSTGSCTCAALERGSSR